jgi:hypothetical protein
MASSPVVSYVVDEQTVVRFEIEPSDDWYDVGSDTVLGRVKDAVSPAVEGAKAVLDAVRQVAPDEIEVKFGIKVSGSANWLIARAATEGNFEITMTWRSKPSPDLQSH